MMCENTHNPDFEERWGFAPDSDYEVIRSNGELTKEMLEKTLDDFEQKIETKLL